jgi:hypothetical protein
MNWSKIDAALAAKLSDDPSWLLGRGARFTVFVTLESGETVTGEWSAAGLADLSAQGWVKSIRGSSTLSMKAN